MPTVLFSLKIALAIWGLLLLHTSFRIASSISVKNAIKILTGKKRMRDKEPERKSREKLPGIRGVLETKLERSSKRKFSEWSTVIWGELKRTV